MTRILAIPWMTSLMLLSFSALEVRMSTAVVVVGRCCCLRVCCAVVCMMQCALHLLCTENHSHQDPPLPDDLRSQ